MGENTGSHFQSLPFLLHQLADFADASSHYQPPENIAPHVGLLAAGKIQPEIPLFSLSSQGSDNNNVTATEKSQVQKENVQLQKKQRKCKVCGKILSAAASYYVHMKMHSDNKPYHCPMCEVSFCRKPYLEVHIRSHTGERPFHCDVCSKRFSQRSSLTVHKRIHTGERPYVCEICERRFAARSYVNAHKWTHMMLKPVCELCNVPFNSRRQYREHLRSHSSLFMHRCACGKAFTKDSNLRRHQLKVHNTGKTGLEIPHHNGFLFHPLYNAGDKEIKKEGYGSDSPPPPMSVENHAQFNALQSPAAAYRYNGVGGEKEANRNERCDSVSPPGSSHTENPTQFQTISNAILQTVAQSAQKHNTTPHLTNLDTSAVHRITHLPHYSMEQ